MKNYDPSKIEKKWQKKWENKDLDKARDFSKKPKKYILVEFPYPSGDGLHVGHIRSYSALDAIARQKRMKGYNVMYPFGWDAFGLPTENYAIRTGIHPRQATDENIKIFKQQAKSLGLSFDWSREIDTTDPKYYKWTQWIFLKFFEQGLAYQAEMPINWCPSCKIGLANEEVIEGKCERCGETTEKRNIKQWLLKITAYADKLIEGLEKVDYPERVKASQINWIGRSHGCAVKFSINNFSAKGGSAAGEQFSIDIFTTRVDTIFGVTALVLAPENEIIAKIGNQISNIKEVEKYIGQAKRKSELQRTSEAKERTGVELKGISTVNPANNEKVPIWIADYVLAHYGGGAVMMVPAHDKRDWDFAEKYKLPIKPVIVPKNANCIVAHGCPSDREKAMNPATRTYDKHWIQWIKKELETRGIKTETPLMPAPWKPDYKAWKKEFEKNDINENTILIGHSCGCSFLVRWLGETKKSILKLILVAPWKIKEDASEAEKTFYEFPIDAGIKERVKDIVIFTADDEAKDGKNGLKMFYKALGGEIINLQDHGHYTLKNMGTEEFPELLDEVFKTKEVFIDDGKLINSEQFNGLKSEEARKKITKWLEEKKSGRSKVEYKLRDWVFSRQHYWGEPIPIIHCEKCGAVPVPEKDLPVELPYVEKYQPTDTGESPLANVKNWINVKCPKCNEPAKRETDTMPNWAGSSWYFLRYIDPKNNKTFADQKKLKYWLEVDLYNGGMEHTTLHLLYSRFWHKFLYDLGLVPTEEPYAKRTSHGIVLAEDKRKMSKSWGNVIKPDEIVKIYGADSLRIYEMFMGPFNQAISWNHNGLVGCFRFLGRVWNIFQDKEKVSRSGKEAIAKLHQLIKKVGEDLDAMKFNTAIASMMEFINLWMQEKQTLSKKDAEIFLKLLSSFAPHISEELWEKLGHKKSIFLEKWPEYNPKLIIEDTFELVVQINGRVRDKINVPTDITQNEAERIALGSGMVKKWTESKQVKKTIFVKNRLINIII